MIEVRDSEHVGDKGTEVAAISDGRRKSLGEGERKSIRSLWSLRPQASGSPVSRRAKLADGRLSRK